MQLIPTHIKDLVVLEPKVFKDDRGFFFESYNQAVFEKLGVATRFVQDNHSRSRKGTLRGLHYQIANVQAKLVRAVVGEIFDVAVDLRKGSATLGKWCAVRLSSDNKRQLFIPGGFAHGFLVLSEVAEVLYKASDFYAPMHERCILWNDPTLKIEWPLETEPVLSAKDAAGVPYLEADLFPAPDGEASLIEPSTA